ncbi:MAG: ABC transporter permease [Bacillota bacterium]|nr:ABC transporter permease [Bacillota bacterium]
MHVQLKTQLKLLFSNKIATLAMIAMPLVLTFLLTKANAGGTQYTLYINDADSSTVSAQYINLLKNQTNLKIVAATAEEVDHALAVQKADAAIKIEKGFFQSVETGSTNKIRILQSYQSADSTLYIQEINQCYDTLLQTYQGAAAAASEIAGNDSTLRTSDAIISSALRTSSNNAAITAESFSLSGSMKNETDNTTSTLMGFLILFVGIIVIQGSRTLIDEKENLTYERMLGMPISFLKVLTVKSVSIFLYCAVNVVIVIAAGRLVFHLQIFNNLLPLCLVFAAYLVAMIGITLMFTLRANNQQKFTAVGIPANILAGMLGGCFFPIDIAPKAIQVISRFTPQGWALSAINSLNAATLTPTLVAACIVFTLGGLTFLAVFFLSHYYRLKLMAK